MENELSLQEIMERREKIATALTELHSWYEERLNTYKSMQRFIQFGLQTGRITEYRKEADVRRYLSRRMIATLEVDSNLLLRSLLIMKSRGHKLQRQLAELDGKIGESA